jgi:CheY-like chemotaxis protein
LSASAYETRSDGLPTREYKRARRQALLREVNEQLRRLAELFDLGGELDLICECGSEECSERLLLAVTDYERIRRSPTHAVVKTRHPSPGAERIVDGDGCSSVTELEQGFPSIQAQDGSVRPSPMRALIVDDDAAFRELVRALVLELGGEVAGEAPDGDDAIALVHELRPDVVLMDVSMPRLDGIAAANAIRQRDASVRIVFLTGTHHEHTIERAQQSGIGMVLEKDSNDLATALAHALDLRKDGRPD